MSMLKPLNISSVTGAMRLRRTQSEEGRPVASCATNAREKLRVAAKINAIIGPFLKIALDTPCRAYSRRVRLVLMPIKRLVAGP